MVKEAVKEDLDSILELYLFLHDDSIPEHNDHLYETWDHILADENYHYIVNEVEGKVVSSCTCLIIPSLTRKIRPYALVEYVVTHENYRGKGYATECLRYAKELAVENNCYKIMLMTGSKKEETLRFYRNAGYSSDDKTGYVQWL